MATWKFRVRPESNSASKKSSRLKGKKSIKKEVEKSSSLVTIQIRFYHEGYSETRKLNNRISIKDWDDNLKAPKKTLTSASLRTEIEYLDSQLSKRQTMNVIQGKSFGMDDMLEVYDEIYKGINKEDFIQFVYETIKEKSGDMPLPNSINRGKRIEVIQNGKLVLLGQTKGINKKKDDDQYQLARGTIRAYCSFHKSLIRFSESNFSTASIRRTKTITFNEINDSLLQKYFDFIVNENYNLNYRIKLLRHMKHFLTKAEEKVLKKNWINFYNNFSLNYKTPPALFVSKDELNKLKKLDLKEERFINTRDVFILGCSLGQRWSDLSKLTINNIKTNKNNCLILSLIQEKTKKLVVINLEADEFSDALEIIEKYKGFPKFPAEQTFNIRIKGLLYLLPEFRDERFKNNVINKLQKNESSEYVMKNGKVVYRYQQAMSHTMRRSFCSNWYMAEKPIDKGMEISGHSNKKEFFTYIHITEENKEDMIKDFASDRSSIIRSLIA